MDDLKYTPIRHDHQEFIAKAGKRKGFKKAYESLGPLYQAVQRLLRAQARSGS